LFKGWTWKQVFSSQMGFTLETCWMAWQGCWLRGGRSSLNIKCKLHNGHCCLTLVVHFQFLTLWLSTKPLYPHHNNPHHLWHQITHWTCWCQFMLLHINMVVTHRSHSVPLHQTLLSLEYSGHPLQQFEVLYTFSRSKMPFHVINHLPKKWIPH